MKKTNIVKLALKIAKKAHKGQFRDDGKTPYITHPIAIVKQIQQNWSSKLSYRDKLIALALLHDVCENNNISEQYLKDCGIFDDVITSLIFLTKTKDQDYLDYILTIKEDVFAIKVKIEDIKHNLSTLDPKKKMQRDKYLLALYILEH